MKHSKRKRSSGHDSKKHKHKKHKKSHHRSKSSGVEKITSEDYYVKITEFKVWLQFHKKKKFEELASTEDTKKYFKKFCKDWNSGELEEMYYESNIPDSIISECNKTKHSWNFVSKLSERERDDLATTADTVHCTTKSKGLPADEGKDTKKKKNEGGGGTGRDRNFSAVNGGGGRDADAGESGEVHGHYGPQSKQTNPSGTHA